MIRITLQERSDQLRAKFEAGVPRPRDEALANSGTRRTEAKRDLLRRIAEDAAAQGRKPPFDAKF